MIAGPSKSSIPRGAPRQFRSSGHTSTSSGSHSQSRQPTRRSATVPFVGQSGGIGKKPTASQENPRGATPSPARIPAIALVVGPSGGHGSKPLVQQRNSTKIRNAVPSDGLSSESAGSPRIAKKSPPLGAPPWPSRNTHKNPRRCSVRRARRRNSHEDPVHRFDRKAAGDIGQPRTRRRSVCQAIRRKPTTSSRNPPGPTR